MKMRYVLGAACLVWLASLNASAAPKRHTVIYDNKPTEVGARSSAAAVATDDLWVTLKDLTRATQFTLKPQGVCRDELCFPIPKARRAAFLAKQGTTTWFNLTEFARLTRQPVAHDAEAATWYFGPRPEQQNAFVASLIAPNFTLPDMHGKPHSLVDFRGKKVLLLTWASW